jgi:hypothetical protein
MKRIVSLLIVMIAFTFGAAAQKGNGDQAVKAANAFGAHLSGFKSAECMNVDTNDDGYCSCTLFLDDNQTKSLECGCGQVLHTDEGSGCRTWLKVDGCREAKAVAR